MSAGNRRRVLSSEERVLWATFTKAIEPLRASADFDAGDDAIPPAPMAAPRGTGERLQPAPQRPAPPLAPLAPLGRRMKRGVARGKRRD